MKIASLVVGVIGSSFGIICSIVLLVQMMFTPVNVMDGDFVIIISILNLILNVIALTVSCIKDKKQKVTGALLIVATVFNALSLGAALESNNPIIFVLYIAITLMLLVAGILRLTCANILSR